MISDELRNEEICVRHTALVAVGATLELETYTLTDPGKKVSEAKREEK